MNEIKLNHRDMWNGEYRNIRFEIMNWKLGDNPCWNYYLYLPFEQIPEAYYKYFFLKGKYERFSPDGREYLTYNYSRTSYISDLDWHGGITFYEKQLDGAGKLVGVKLGCDYAHYFDEQNGYNYDLNFVLMETKNSIDKLHKLVPHLKVSCRWDGKYYDISECEELPQGGYVAIKNKDNFNGAKKVEAS